MLTKVDIFSSLVVAMRTLSQVMDCNVCRDEVAARCTVSSLSSWCVSMHRMPVRKAFRGSEGDGNIYSDASLRGICVIVEMSSRRCILEG